MRREDRERMGGDTSKDSGRPEQQPRRPEHEKVKGGGSSDDMPKHPHPERESGKMPLPE